jgi:sortase B
MGFPDVDWEYWQGVNPDIVGWVTVPGTNIDYPIVQAHADDPSYYLHHDIYRNYNVYGVPYVDADCEDLGLSAQNVYIYGHHMNNDTMFSAFANYSDKDFANEHEVILLQTPDSKQVLHVRFSRVVNAATERKQIDFPTTQDYINWYQNEALKSSSALDTESVPVHSIVFVTCSYNIFNNERTLVYASNDVSFLTD